MKLVLIWLAFLLITLTVEAQSVVRQREKTTVTAEQSQLEKRVVGVWSFVNQAGAGGSTDKKIKIILDKHWMFSQPEPGSNITLYHHGGTYVVNGNTYAETIDYANESTGGLLGQTFSYEVTVRGDTLLMKGLGNPWSEAWKRVK